MNNTHTHTNLYMYLVTFLYFCVFSFKISSVTNIEMIKTVFITLQNSLSEGQT